MKKTVLSLAVAGALLVTGPLASSAEQIDGSNKNVYEGRYVVSVNNSTNWNDLIQNLLKKYYSQYGQTQPKVEQPTQLAKEPTEQKAEEPVQERPVVQQPVQQQPVDQTKETTNQATYSLSQFEQEVVTLTNKERAKNGLQPLKIDLKLSEVARTKSSDMKKNGYFSHTSPTYGSPFDMMKQFGIQYRAAGENIAKGQRSPQEVVNAWMNSEGHRKNILSSNFTHIGVGHVEGNYWTQMFIGK
ncbi:CAP domain-containing protein [Fredinandcohnia sp. QZ13]|uniref:CAP domain-containing protein n=1 Tax=Fredinandcohnia sp. QZ13 TaxID=3073144 RepID=UPI0028530FB2|nr:CAP domain-containing protein [Fredinandcohnia sp. QZ13]MDR4887764.1 CAP domain-containing protein [Fredinandcohnia sp. QZ13]